MTAQLLDPDHLASAARAALEATVAQRVDSVRHFVELMHAARAAEEHAARARAESEAAWTAALQAGWTEKELRTLGVHAPTEAAAKSPRRRRSTTSPNAGTDD